MLANRIPDVNLISAKCYLASYFWHSSYLSTLESCNLNTWKKKKHSQSVPGLSDWWSSEASSSYIIWALSFFSDTFLPCCGGRAVTSRRCSTGRWDVSKLQRPVGFACSSQCRMVLRLPLTSLKLLEPTPLEVRGKNYFVPVKPPNQLVFGVFNYTTADVLVLKELPDCCLVEVLFFSFHSSWVLCACLDRENISLM